MIVDTSAVLAVLQRESDADLYIDVLAESDDISMGSPTYLECFAVINRARSPQLDRKLDQLISETGIVVVSFTPEMAIIARQAYKDFGKGSGHPAKLNYGDCFSYAVALNHREPLLWKGDDFTHTGIDSAIPRG